MKRMSKEKVVEFLEKRIQEYERGILDLEPDQPPRLLNRFEGAFEELRYLKLHFDMFYENYE